MAVALILSGVTQQGEDFVRFERKMDDASLNTVNINSKVDELISRSDGMVQFYHILSLKLSIGL